MSNTKTVYRFDSAGYYIGTSLAQYVNDELLMPSDCTETKPTLKDGYWSKWNGSKWVNEKIPATCAEAIKKGLSCISNGQGQHNYEVKTLLESLVAADSEHYRTVVSSDFVEQIEEIPAKTLDEVKADKLAELSSVADNYAQYKCPINMYIVSSTGFKVDADVCSQTNMQGLILMLGEGESCQYKDFNNEFQTVTREQLTIMVGEAKQNGLNLYQTKFQLEAQINAATSIEEVEAIEIKFEMLDFSKSE